MIKQRCYQNAADLILLQNFNARASAQTSGCGFIHPGDIPHRLFNGNKYLEPSEVLSIWEDEAGVAAWVLTSPRHKIFDAQVRPDLRDSGFEREILIYAEARTLALIDEHKIEAKSIYADSYQCDTVRARLLADLGWTLDIQASYTLNRASLNNLPEPILPEGYHIRAARGIEEAAALAEVHAASFGSSWTPELYQQVMQSPGYAAEREFVVEASDGSLAAFTVTWHDHHNRTGSLEPVGTHREHRRRGLGRALVTFAMHHMAEAGMAYATVLNENKNEAARELYRVCGFTPWHVLDDFSKPIPS